MLATIALSLIGLVAFDEPIYDARQFQQIMRSLHAPVRDVTFLFEGKDLGLPVGVTVAAAIEGEAASRAVLCDTFQGAYALRADGASYLDLFQNTARNGAVIPSHQTFANLHGQKRQVSRFPERRNEQPTTEGGGPGTMNRPGSPERINLLYFFFPLADYAARHFRHLGWETVDGHRCAVVQFDLLYGDPRPESERPLFQFWIDLERGGHALRVEDHNPQQGLRMRTVAIRLAEVDCAGQPVWFPVEGRCETFMDFGGRKPTEPAGVELYSVVGGTIRFNQNLTDASFAVERPFPGTEGLDPLRTSFRVPRPRNDPRGVQERLAAEFARANQDDKSPEIRVEPMATGWVGWIQPTLVGIGCGSILAGIWIWKRFPQ